MKKIHIKVTPEMSNMRIDLAWVKADIGLSRRKIRQIIDVGGAYHNRKRVRIASRVVQTGDTITLQYNLESLKAVRRVDLAFKDEEIVFHDSEIIVVNKPPLMPSQATRDQSVMHVESCLKKLFLEKPKGPKNFLICHRLDKETSGILVVAKNKKANAAVMEQFKQKTTEKTYIALCTGKPEKREWSVRCYLSTIQKKTGAVSIVNSGGKPSFTKFKLLGYNSEFNISLIACFPETGRSHQLRVHLESCELPILGDKKYGQRVKSNTPASISGCYSIHHMLHALCLKFVGPEKNEPLTVKACLPPKFQEIFDLCGFDQSVIESI